MSALRIEPETNEHWPNEVHVHINHEGDHCILIGFYFNDPIHGKLLVPRCFRSDGFSFPWFVRPFWPKEQPSMKAAYLHDYLFRTKQFSLLVTNQIMKRAMALDPTPLPTWKQKGIMLGLHIGSWWPWIINRKTT